MRKLSKLEVDALKEISNMGAGHAANALSQMINTKIEITVPDFDIIPLEQFPKAVGGQESAVVGTYVQLQGDIVGTVMFLFPIEYALSLADVMLGREVGSSKELSEMDSSALQEVGNIMASSFANAISDFLGFKIIPTPPAIAFDMAGALLNFLIAELGQKVEEAIFFNTTFITPQREIIGHLLLSPEPESMEKILEAIKEKFGLQ